MDRVRRISRTASPLIFGEVLFDHFLDDDTRLLGGAPFNVAWHLQGFGLRPILISRIGRDKEGEKILSAMRDWGMDRRGIQMDEYRPTGRVEIRLRNGEPEFDALPEQAYDFIEFEPAELLMREQDGGLLYHGSLAARSPKSRRTLEELTRRVRAAFVDINLRKPWWSPHSARVLLRDKPWVKLNRDELQAITDGATNDIDGIAESVRDRLGIEVLIVTMDAEGARIFSKEGSVTGEPDRGDNIVDTVGAGDAFAAVAILGATYGWDHVRLLERASAFAGAVCRIRGATPDQEIYNRFMSEWGL